jgi:Mn-dependent DtxR family transcriptional regulator
MNVFHASNVTKLDVLRLLASLPGLGAAQTAERLRISPEASGMLLLRLARAGLLIREPEHGVFVYRLTAKGHARHTYLAHRTDARTE